MYAAIRLKNISGKLLPRKATASSQGTHYWTGGGEQISPSDEGEAAEANFHTKNALCVNAA